MDTTEIARSMADVAAALLDEPDEQIALDMIVAKAVDVVRDADHASVTVRDRRHHHETLAATSDVAMAADALQYELDEGPCIETADHVEWIRSGQVGLDARWPRWGPRAADLQVGSLLAVPLYAQERRVGALNLYSEALGAFDDVDEIDLALVYATHAAYALLTVRKVAGLGSALVTRHEIGVAQGIIMERYGTTVDRSFEFLRRLSSHSNRKLAQVAHQIVATRTIPTSLELAEPAEGGAVDAG